jgi:hypothetical protein
MEVIRRVAFCPHCGNRAPQRHIYTQEYLGQGYSMDGTLSDDTLPCAYYVAVCETCNEILLYHSFIDIVEDKDFHRTELIWPDPGVLHQSVPKTIAECYSEAARIKNLTPNAFAVQIRRALEALCDDRGAKKGNLQSRLQDLASRGEIPPVLAEITDVLRLLGNIGAHAADQNIKPGHVPAIDNFFRAIIEYVYVAPSKLKEFQNRMKSLKIMKDTSDDA